MFEALFSFLQANAAAVSAATAVVGLVQGQKASEAQKKAQEAQGKMAAMEAHRARIQAVREARIKRAQVLASDADMGGTTSGIAGGVSSVASQLGSNIGFQSGKEQLANQASIFNQQAIDANSSASIFNTVAGVSSKMVDWQKLWNPAGVPSVEQMQINAGKR